MTETGLDLWIWTLAGISLALICFGLVCMWVACRNTCQHGVPAGEKCAECAARMQAILDTEPLRVMWDDEAKSPGGGSRDSRR